MADAVAEDGLGDDGLLVHDGLDHLGDVRGGDLGVLRGRNRGLQGRLGGGAVAGEAKATVKEEAVSVAAEATAQTVTSQATVADEQSRVGDGQRDESGNLRECSDLKIFFIFIFLNFGLVHCRRQPLAHRLPRLVVVVLVGQAYHPTGNHLTGSSVGQRLIGSAQAIVVLCITQPQRSSQHGEAVSTAVAHDGQRVSFELVHKGHALRVGFDVPQVANVRSGAVHIAVVPEQTPLMSMLLGLISVMLRRALGGEEGGRRRPLGLEERHRALGEEEEEGRNRTLGEEERNSSEQGEEQSSLEREQEQGLSSLELGQRSPRELLQNRLQNLSSSLREEEQNKLELEQHKLVGHHRRNRPEIKRDKS
ncbi:hypothetical protein TYRP_023696 [Tyrophagus putrescentiae]|nr:hypothetical protein TYRP_023696 [Tyrophagus putrescentiae]